jgi:hypothetical protein
MAKIAKQDADAMNYLLASEQNRMKIAGKFDDQNGAPKAPQAIEDHKEYTDLVSSVLAEGDRTAWSPNDLLMD